MKTWICEICGDAYLGDEAPHSCPFCGARRAFIKVGEQANPVVLSTDELSSETKSYIQETLELELRANAIYTCMAEASKDYEVIKMYRRLARVEMEHAVICTKLLKIAMPEAHTEICSQQDVENFKQTVELEEHASSLYADFARRSVEKHIRIMFTALNQAEMDHIT
ncbi:hypothetical protein HGA64_05300 [Candidatus Falkowbacteria bacterium]|nr:hypothetical protein [Candidatus Falkowbacteria bacterium]